MAKRKQTDYDIITDRITIRPQTGEVEVSVYAKSDGFFGSENISSATIVLSSEDLDGISSGLANKIDAFVNGLDNKVDKIIDKDFLG